VDGATIKVFIPQTHWTDRSFDPSLNHLHVNVTTVTFSFNNILKLQNVFREIIDVFRESIEFSKESALDRGGNKFNTRERPNTRCQV